MTSNLFGKGFKINSDYITRMLVPEGDDPEMAAACAELRTKMISALKKVNAELFGFSYQPSQIAEFTRNVQKDAEKILEFGAFAQALDNQRIQEMLKQCSAREICEFRKAYDVIYHLPNHKTYLGQDKASLEELSVLVRELASYDNYDRIQRKNIQEFVSELDRIVESLS